jgi:hypothetical protein
MGGILMNLVAGIPQQVDLLTDDLVFTAWGGRAVIVVDYEDTHGIGLSQDTGVY